MRTKNKTTDYLCIYIVLFISLWRISALEAAPRNAFASKYAEIVIDANSGRTLFAENENARRYPASLTKLMTLFLLFDAIKSGRVSLNTPIPVSSHAASMPPTKIGFKSGESITAENAAKAMITKSANDVAVAVAEYLGGSEANFAQMMTRQAYRLGMMNTHFSNASGLPDKNNYSTARDLATLSLSLRRYFPDLYYLFKTTSFRFRGKTIRGHNHLLDHIRGVDGLKTGYTVISGYNLATSYRTAYKNLVAVVMGWRSAYLRDARMSALLMRFIPSAMKIRDRSHTRQPLRLTINFKNDIPLPTFKSQSLYLSDVSSSNHVRMVGSIYQTKAQKQRAIQNKSKENHTIQIGTAKTISSARALYKKVLNKNKRLIAMKPLRIVATTSRKHKIYRVRIEGFTKKIYATRACQILKRQHLLCYVVS